MIISPIQNNTTLGVQTKPKITQRFGENAAAYKKFGYNGHEGLDMRAAIGTKLYAPIEGKVEVLDSGDKAYGLHVKITNDRLRVILAHLSEVSVQTGQFVPLGEQIGLSGNSGNSQAPHLHVTLQKMKDGKVSEPKNGYGGAFDFQPYIIYWSL